MLMLLKIQHGAQSFDHIFELFLSILFLLISSLVTKCSERQLHDQALHILLISFQVFIAPPLYRDRPLWYQQNLNQVAARFSSTFSGAAPGNLHLLPSFMSQSLDPDGIHLNPVSGLHYLLHLYDSTIDLISQFDLSADSRVLVVQETVRQHDDRLAYLENRHGALAANCDIKFARDAEFNDWVSNRSQEDWMTILGLPRISAANDREWQLAVKRQINDAIKLVL